ncbi:hypothetical protein FA15DRAFT_672873 [Coprinopsis marcescibilis]|uniref:Actin-like ATPase domain-containing protein n=1 Tax=Coprinopsis marcescibilis TaxID=230819 RepID=A0A5C3KLP0_COPMA|nr:hypothetical protein FA15DRAFT_672873 [Coprinopsis marcescibilis]
MAHLNRRPYGGSRRKLVLAFDVGTTYSGISYSVLDPGQVPEIKGVTRFPAHEQISGASKIPTVIYYDKGGNMCATGAEAMREGIYEMAMDEAWVKTEWFKLHIRPKSGDSQHVTMNIPPLPLGKTVVQVLADFLQYLYKCAKSYIQDTHASGRDLWESVESEIDYVISHPNGWEGYQQSQIREAVVLARLVPDTNAGHSRVSFVTEGEASLHFSIDNGLPAGAMKNGEGVVIVDAGGGTVDVSAYGKKMDDTNKAAVFDEIAAPQCHFHGSVFVSIHARLYLEKILDDSDFIEDLDHIVRCFDKSTKVRFSSDKQAQYIKFGGTRDNDEACNIRFGQLKLAGSDVAQFFEPSVKCIVDAVLDQIKNGHHTIKHVVLVGGFSASDWLYSKIDEVLSPKGLNVIRPENHVNKAVSDGALSFYLDHFVKSRVSKVAYGSFCHIPYDNTDPEHRSRESTTFLSVSNSKRIGGFFQVVLPKNTQVAEEKEFRYQFWYEFESKESLKSVKSEVWCYKGSNANPKWKDTDTDNYSKLCAVEMDLSHLPITPKAKSNGQTGNYWYLEYNYILNFSSVELRAQISWMERGVEKRSPAKIVYDPNDV